MKTKVKLNKKRMHTEDHYQVNIGADDVISAGDETFAIFMSALAITTPWE